jgi:signal transduction histidine kinase
MRRLFRHRVTLVAGWGALLATILVSALGLRLTILQYRAVHGTLLDLYRRTAETQRRPLENLLQEAEERILRKIEARCENLEELAILAAEEPLVEEPFCLLGDGSTLAPHLRRSQPRSPFFSDEPEPAEYEAARQAALRGVPLPEKLAALDEVRRSPAMAAAWRLRAASAAAALYAREGRFAEAAEAYRLLFEEFSAVLPETTSPSYLQLVLARGRCLVQAGRGNEAYAVLEAGLERLAAGTISTTPEEKEFFLLRAGEVFGSLTAGAPRALQDLELRAREERLSRALVESLRDWVFAPRGVDGSVARPGVPQHYFQESPAGPILAVWSRAESAATSTGLAAAGFRVKLPRLEEMLTAALAALPNENRFVVKTRPGAERFVSLAALSGERWFLELGLPVDEWKSLVGQARGPFVIAAVLSVLLGLVLLAGFWILLRSMRQELLLSRLKTEFVANVSHELKTPLALIRLFGETLLLDRVPDAESRRKYYEIITRESERLGHLISNLLNFSSIEAGKKTYDLRACDVGDVARRTVESYRHDLGTKGFRCDVDAEEGLPPVSADADAVSQALLNLLENAVKYSPEEKVISVRVRGVDGSVRLSVKDRGVGIPPEEQPLIWQDYYRARQARELRARGTGLGLSVVQHIMKAHRGGIELESAPGKGSIFTLVFPVLGTVPEAKPEGTPAAPVATEPGTANDAARGAA